MDYDQMIICGYREPRRSPHGKGGDPPRHTPHMPRFVIMEICSLSISGVFPLGKNKKKLLLALGACFHALPKNRLGRPWKYAPEQRKGKKDPW